VKATVAAPTLFLQPLVGTLLAVLLLGERLGQATVVGGALIVTGIWIVSTQPEKAADVVIAAEVIP
jgi:drug/metabolite transporter (DMT)-like permease